MCKDLWTREFSLEHSVHYKVFRKKKRTICDECKTFLVPNKLILTITFKPSSCANTYIEEVPLSSMEYLTTVSH